MHLASNNPGEPLPHMFRKLNHFFKKQNSDSRTEMIKVKCKKKKKIPDLWSFKILKKLLSTELFEATN